MTADLTLPLLSRSPMAKAVDYATRDLKRSCTPAETEWLYAHPDLWLVALGEIESEVIDHAAKANARLADMKPEPGEQPSTEYVQAKRDRDNRRIARLHFHGIVQRRRKEVAALAAEHGPSAMRILDVVGGVVALMERGTEDGDERAYLRLAALLRNTRP